MMEIERGRFVFYVFYNRIQQPFSQHDCTVESGDKLQIQMEFLANFSDIRHTTKRESQVRSYFLDVLGVFLCWHENSLYRPSSNESNILHKLAKNLLSPFRRNAIPPLYIDLNFFLCYKDSGWPPSKIQPS